ncbi:hypothetical protein glysoja_015062, partial [Glycine soja]
TINPAIFLLQLLYLRDIIVNYHLLYIKIKKPHFSLLTHSFSLTFSVFSLPLLTLEGGFIICKWKGNRCRSKDCKYTKGILFYSICTGG